MAYVFNNSLSPLLSQGSQQQQQPQKPQTSAKSNFQDPNKLLQKNMGAQQGAVNTAVTGQAQKQFAQSNAQLDKDQKQYMDTQKFTQQGVSNVAADVKAGGNKLGEILKGPQFQAQKFQTNVTNSITPGADVQGQIQRTMRNRSGDFYSQGESALDAALFKQSGAQAKADSQINQMSQALGNRLGQVGNLEQQATQQGQAAQAQLQAETAAQVKAYRDQLKTKDAEDFFKRYRQEQEDAARIYAQQARDKQAGISQEEIMDKIRENNYYKGMGDYISPETLAEQNTIAGLFGEGLRSDAGSLTPFIDTAARDANVNKLIDSRIIAPPTPAPLPVDKIAEARKNVLYNSQRKTNSTAEKKKNDALIEKDMQFLRQYGIDPFLESKQEITGMLI